MSWKKFKEQTEIDIWDLWPDLQVMKNIDFTKRFCLNML
jgi:hypothetical protein